MLLFFLTGISAAGLAQDFVPHLTGPYGNVSGQFFIRLKLAYSETQGDPWATNLGAAELERRTAHSFEILNAVFNPHGIYFVPRAGLDMGCYTIMNSNNIQSDSTCITVVIVSDNGLPNGTTIGNTLPTNLCQVGGNENGIPASNTSVLVHEIGHCLGLAHPFAYTVLNGNQMAYNGPLASCSAGTQGCIPPASNNTSNKHYCCGDMIDDTPMFESGNGLGQYVQVNTGCNLSTQPAGVDPEIFKNFVKT